MAASGFTPIQLYRTTTAAAVPLAADLSAGELAINTTDEKLYFKNAAGTVKLLASNTTTTNVASITFGTTGLTPATATTGAVTVAGTLAVANGGTGTTSTTFANLTTNVTGTLPIANGGTGTTSTTFANLTTNVTGTLPIANGGTGTTSTTFANLTTNVTGTLPIANGGTGTTSTTFANLTTNVTGTLPVANGGSGAVTLTGVLKGNGTSAFTAATAGTDYVAPGTATTFTALQTFAGTASNADLKTSNILEVATVSATAATGTIAYDVTTQSVLYYTTNASGNFTVNFRGSSGTTLNTVMQTGESISATFLVTNGATAYYNSVVQVDGSTVTPKWQGGSAPTSGNASSIDSYTYVIIKTGSAAFTVLASITKFA